MKKIGILIILSITILSPCVLFADAQEREWLGEWDMNHDGWKGVLRIVGVKADCMAPEWCDMALSYIDSKGTVHKGEIEKIDSKGHQMSFYIKFPNNNQKFEAYLFSWDKRKIAGTTRWNGRTFGFYAIKK